MPLIKFISHSGDQHEVQVASGSSVMQAAVDNGIEGILADCGGACSCATCHCYVDEAWAQQTGQPDDAEEQMLDFVMERQPNSRLSCQITVDDQMEGLIIRLPVSQC